MVSHGYIIKEFETEKECLNDIKNAVDKNDLLYQKVYDHTEKGIRVLIYQGYMLCTGTFIIHKKYNLRRDQNEKLF